MPESKNIKQGWKIWRFDQIARNITERAEPTPEDSARYVGLEHMDSGSLRIRRWGSKTDLIGTKFRIRKGDILFARRNAYLKRVAIAPHDGLFSAHGMVLQANPDAVLPEFLPFFMQSDLFMNMAVEISVGSLSPTINWKTMASQEFVLPPKEEQAAPLTLLSALQSSIDAADECKRSAEIALEAFLSEVFDEIPEVTSLQSMCRPIVRGIDSPGPEVDGGVPYVRIAEMTGPDGIRLSNLKRTSKEIADEHPESRLDEGDIVVALRGVVGMPVRTPGEAAGANLSRGTARVSVRDHCVPDYVFWALRSPRVRKEVLRFATGWKGEDLREITLTELRTLSVPIVDRAEQEQIAANAESLAAATSALARRSDAARALMKMFIERMMSGERRVY